MPAACDALIWSLGHRITTREQLLIANELWSIGVSADIHLDSESSLEDVKDHCRANRIGYLIVQKDSDISIIKVR